MTAGVYLSSEEIQIFRSSSEIELIGFYYEWEGENVVHIHTHPLTHAFGKVGSCIFTKSKEINILSLTEDIRFVVYVGDNVKLYSVENGKTMECQPNFIPSKDDLYSRAKGLIEVDVLENKHVAIVGLGSFGSQIAIELAKAGVGEFSLFDFDRVELHNLGRHTCALKDLGRLKTDAIEESIHDKNPYARIHKYPMDITKEWTTFKDVVAAADLVICATDNNASRFVIATALHEYQKVGIYGRAITRAAGGDVFRQRPDGPCYACLLGSQIINPRDEEISSEEAGRRSGAIAAYTSSADGQAMVQVGLSVDIAPICNLMLKIALMELSRGENSGISSLEEDLQYDAYIWANRRDQNFSAWHSFYQAGPKPTILKWYGIKVPKDDNCAICSDNIILDEGEGYQTDTTQDFIGVKINLD